jgi:hypothetical protein
VDEAAAIPLPLVKDMLGPYLVFLSSTISGYVDFLPRFFLFLFFFFLMSFTKSGFVDFLPRSFSVFHKPWDCIFSTSTLLVSICSINRWKSATHDAVVSDNQRQIRQKLFGVSALHTIK